ncbi:ISL3 family transposase [Ktedonobacter racemifer]|uniref:Transposase IS204/IS1001/IS1096/IS1165 family protein n=1 Tax=Ktedonobacter racemifer DSM 44963 TaxID=485913 RepID=D6TC21_KTERA|nr:ISL3 family transposase [Ktedonobacter racemifer]EFH88057.1 transposase IS204/IS1001/IS1096/IS1165 family protein [Ktedonobacter racemifer DSM 44963]
METPLFFPLGEGLELTQMERNEEQLVLHIIATSTSALCPLCAQPATRLHSRYRRIVKDLPCAGQQVRLILHVRKFFCDTVDCVRKVFAERLPHLVAPWAQMTTRLTQALQMVGLATCGRLGARLASHLGITTSWMTIVRRVMDLPTPKAQRVTCLGLDDFSFQRGRTFGTVVVDLDAHQIIDLLPDRQADTAAAWMATHPEITHVSRDRGAEYASAASTGAPQAIQVADRFHICKNLSEAVQKLLARVLSEIKTASQEAERKAKAHEDTSAPVEEWRPDPGAHVARTIAIRRAEREVRYQQAVSLRKQGLSLKEIARQLGTSERTVRHWFERGVAPDTRPRRKRQSDFDPYAPYVLQRWQDGEHNGSRLWQEIAAQGYPGSQRMVYRFLKTLKKTEVKTPIGTRCVLHYTSSAAVRLFMRHPGGLDEGKRVNLDALRQAHPALETAYHLTQDFLLMMRKREGERLDTWLIQVQESGLPELQSFAHGVERDKAAVQAGLTLPINNGQVEGHVTRVKLIKRMMYGKAGFALLRQRVLHRI